MKLKKGTEVCGGAQEEGNVASKADSLIWSFINLPWLHIITQKTQCCAVSDIRKPIRDVGLSQQMFRSDWDRMPTVHSLLCVPA